MIRLLIVCGLVTMASSVSAQPEIDRAAEVVAQALAEAVVARNEEAVAVLFALPVNLDGEVITTMEALQSRWASVLDRAEVRGLRLVEIELLPMATAIERHGTPPRRLGELPTEDALVAVLRFDRAMIVVILARRDGRWAVIATTD